MSGRGRSQGRGGRGRGDRNVGGSYNYPGRGRGGGRGSGRGRGGGGRGGGGGRQPDKDKRNINKEIQVSVNAFKLQGNAEAIDAADFVVAEPSNPLVSKEMAGKVLQSIDIKPEKYLIRPDGSILIDPNIPARKLNQIWETGSLRAATKSTSAAEEASDAGSKAKGKIALVDAVHRAWDIQADDFDRTGSFVFSKRIEKKDTVVPGVAVRTGHMQSIRQSPDGKEAYMITKPVAAPVTVRETLFNFLVGLKLMDKNGRVTNAPAVGDVVRGLRVDSNCKTYKIYMKLDGVQGSRDSNKVGAKNTFFDKDGKQVSVYDHFKETYKIELQYPDAPLAFQRKKNHFIFVPIELLSLIGGKIHQSIQSDEILKRSKMSADDFMKKCKAKAELTDRYVKHLKRVGDLLISRASLNGVSSDYLKAKAIVLPTPKISVKDSKRLADIEFEPEGNWNWRDRAALIPPGKQELKIGFVDGTNNANAMDNCVDPICKEMKIHTGKKIHAVRLGMVRLTDKKALEKLLATRGKIDCLVALLPERDNTASYKAVKRVCDSRGLPSQCIKKWDRALNPQHSRNLVLKMNGKVGGINHSVRNVAFEKYMPMQDKTSNTLFVGIDVYHGGLEVMSDSQDDKPQSSDKSRSGTSTSSDKRPDSTLAMVGMFGPDLRHTTIALQNVPGGTEIMPAGFSAVIQRCLDGWRKKTGKKNPGTVVVYRDGIGISSYDAWFESEITNGFRKVLPQSSDLVVVLSTKRHDVRFSIERDGQQTNLDSGTVIHNVPFLENESSFYLQSYKALSGGLTAKATHYQVFVNDCGWSMRFIFDLTYALTHIQQRASGAVAIPAPVAAADLAAYRARPYVKDPDTLKKLEGTELNQWFL